jgi:chemotaxis protein histidine kinase CheA
VSRGVDDLLPLFLSEAKDRLERLTVLAQEVEQDAETARKARRELHALKGASNMMQLREMSSMCHEAEELLNPPGEGAATRLLTLLDRLMTRLGELAGGAPDAPREGAQAAGDETMAAAAAPEPAGAAATSADASELRVPTPVLDRLADGSARLRVLAVGAGTVVDRIFQLARLAERGVRERLPEQVLATVATSLRQLGIELEGSQRTWHHLADGQLETLLKLQIQPLRPFLLNLARHARELGRSLGKTIEVAVSAGDSHLDRRIIEALQEVFLHLVRNAVDHGIEAPEVRQAAAKPAVGQLRLHARSEGGRVRIEVVDDGAGIDPTAVVEAAVQRGLISPDEGPRLTIDEALQLLFISGFSTRDTTSEVSGRGVGLDAVAAAVHGVGGDMWLNSRPGNGTTVVLDVPVARRGERVFVLRVGDGLVALPAAVVKGFRRIEPDTVWRENGRCLTRSSGQLVEVKVLGEALGESSADSQVMVEGVVAGAPHAVIVDEVLGEEEVLLRPLPNGAGAHEIFDGMALLASGRPVPVVAPHRLAGQEGGRAVRTVPRQALRSTRLLLVDDCLVTREMVRRLLEDGGFAVTPVGSASEALKALAEGEFDCLVTDIEMPEMDGLELTRHLRTTPRYAQLPVVVVSTRSSSADRLAGLEAGADAYLAKQGLDARELVTVIHRVGGRS